TGRDRAPPRSAPPGARGPRCREPATPGRTPCRASSTPPGESSSQTIVGGSTWQPSSSRPLTRSTNPPERAHCAYFELRTDFLPRGLCRVGTAHQGPLRSQRPHDGGTESAATRYWRELAAIREINIRRLEGRAHPTKTTPPRPLVD